VRRQSEATTPLWMPHEVFLMTTIKLWLSTIKSTLTNLGALAVFAIIYALLLLTFFRFIWIKEATVWQVLFTYTFIILIPLLFFIFQAAIIDRVRDQKFRWRAIVIDALKFLAVTIPMLLIAWLLYYLVNKIAGRYPAPIVQVLPVAPAPAKPAPLHWPSLLFATLRFVLMGVALPLATIHLWIAIAGGEVRSLFSGGAQPLLKRLGSALARAFGSEAVLIYALGLIIFFALPYAALWVPFSPKGNKTDFAVFIFRLLLTYLFSLIGWVVTISALTKNALTEPEAQPLAAPSVAPATATVSEVPSPS
jgi:hypothetical protein